MSTIHTVYKAYVSGCRTTGEVSAVTGLPVKTCSAYTMQLIARNRLLRKVGTAPRFEPRHGRSFNWYEPVPNRRVKGFGA